MQESNRKSLLLRMPVLPLRGMMVFPHMVLHFDVGRPKSVAALEKAMMGDQRIFLVAQMDAEIDEPELSLHIDWQRALLPALLEQGTSNQLILATHSPFIYANYPEKEILLSSGVELEA